MNVKLGCLGVVALLLVPTLCAQAGSFPAGAGDDLTTSLGKFKLIVDAPLRPLISGLPLPGFTNTVAADGRLESPLLYDPATLVGRSNPHLDGDATDVGGAVVGTAGTIVKEADFGSVPAAFGDVGSREVHTEVRTLDLDGSFFGFAGNNVRAGTLAPAQPVSPGEVESQSLSGIPANDFPGDSFFNIFVEIDIEPGGGLPPITLYNSMELLVESVLTDPPGFPPKVLYTHGGTTQVPVYFRSDSPDLGGGPGTLWLTGDKFGVVVLAGHGIGFTDSQEDQNQFNNEYENLTEIVPEPTSLIICSQLVVLGLAVGRRRRRVVG